MTYARDENVQALAQAFGADVRDIDAKAEAAPRAFANRDELVSSPGDTFQIAEAEGVLYRRSPGLALPGLNNWRPLNDTLDIRHVGSVSELSSDFVGRFMQAANDAADNGWTLNVSRKADGTPYEYRFIDHTLSGDLRIQFDRNALFIPAPNFQHFPTNGSQGPFKITAWPYSAASDGVLSGMLVDGVTETKFVQGTHFTVSGDEVTLTAVPSPTSTFVAVARKDALQFRSSLGAGRKLILSGDLSIDLSRIGYAIASASGSGLTLTNIDHWAVERLWVSSPSGYGSAALDRRGDSAFVPLGFKTGYANRIHAEGMNDLAVYATGGASSGHEDDPQSLYIGSIHAKRCSAGMKYVRQGEQAYIGSIHLVECGTGYLSGLTDGIPTGQGVHIGSINAIRLGRRALDVRGMPQGGLHVNAISVRDIGYLPDGLTAEDAPAAIYMQGAAGIQVDYLDVRQRDWTAPAGTAAVQMASSGNFGNRVLGGWVSGLAAGVRETGATTNDVGNSFTMTMKDVATPIDSAGAMQTHYDLIVLTEVAGAVTQKRVNNLWSERLTGTPTLMLAGATNSPVYSYTLQTLLYRRMLDYVEFNLQIQGIITHSEPSGRSLRVYLPAAITNAGAVALPVTLGRVQGLTLPANSGLWAEMAPGANYVRFYYRPADGSAPVEVTSSHVTSGVAVRFEVSGAVPV